MKTHGRRARNERREKTTCQISLGIDIYVDRRTTGCPLKFYCPQSFNCSGALSHPTTPAGRLVTPKNTMDPCLIHSKTPPR